MEFTPTGTAGEFYAQSEEEFDRIQLLLAERCERHRIAFQIGINHMAAQVSRSRLLRAVSLKPGAFQVILPDWFPLRIEETVAFLQKMAELAAPVPLVLYNPPHAKVILSPSDYARVCRDVSSLVGVKVAGGDADWFDAMRRASPELSIFVPGHQLASGIRLGASGSYSNVACLQPAGASRWYQLMQRDIHAAVQFEGRIQRFLSDYVVPFQTRQGFSNQALDKLLAYIGDWASVGTRLRWPYRWIPEAEARDLRSIARKCLPELFEC